MTTLTIAPTTAPTTTVNPLELVTEYHRVLSEIRKDVNTNRGEHKVSTEDIKGTQIIEIYDFFYRTECYLVIESTNQSALKRLQSTYTVCGLGGTISDMLEINWTSSFGKNKSFFSMRLKSHIEIMDQQEFVVGYMKKQVKRYKKGLVSAMDYLESVAQKEHSLTYELPKLSDSKDHYHYSHQIAEWEKIQTLYQQLAKKLELCERTKYLRANPTSWALDLVKLLDTSESLNHRRFDFTNLDRKIESHIRWFLMSLVSDKPINPHY